MAELLLLLFPMLLLLFSHSVVSDSLWPHGLQHARLPCPLPSPRACSNSCPSGWWCHPTVSSSTVPFSSCLQSFPASGSFLLSWLFTSGGQSIGTSASVSVLPVNSQDWFPLGLTYAYNHCVSISAHHFPTYSQGLGQKPLSSIKLFLGFHSYSYPQENEWSPLHLSSSTLIFFSPTLSLHLWFPLKQHGL